ncbi:MAG: N-acetylmuramoyl-L-alanine amidase family protein [candidate division WOR-3 bacterium]
MTNTINLLLASISYVNVPYVCMEKGDFVPPDSVFCAFGMSKSDEEWIATQIKEVKIRVDDNGMKLNDKYYGAPESFWKGDVLYMPAEYLSFILCKVIKGYAYWDRDKKRFFVKTEDPTIASVSLEDKGDSVCLTLKYVQGVHLRPQTDPSKPSLLVISVPGGFYWKTFRIEGTGPVKEIRIDHTEAGMVLRVSLSEGAAGYGVVDKAELFAVSVYKAKKLKEPEKKKRKIDLIVIDAGHGGKDPGAVGYNDLYEKNITLPVALALKKVLEKELGVKVILTRDEDRFVTLGDRARIANRAGADLFISLHCNWAKNKDACGVETYFLAAARTDWERSVAAFENKAIEYESESQDKADMIGFILSDMIQNEYLKESQDLAAYIHEGIMTKTDFVDRGVKQAGFYVLRGCYMPAVLVEMGFISNKSDANELQKKEVQERLVRGIAQGIKEFVKHYER